MDSSTPGRGARPGGRYRLGERLGRGGMGDVYRATDQVLARQVAVKLFRPDVSDEALHLRHESEARVLAGLNHPGLVVGLRHRHGRRAAVPRDGAGRGRDARGPDPPRAARAPRRSRSLGGQLAASLQAIHDAGVIHRDIKPANVLVCASDDGDALRTKLTDFGIARLVDGTRLTSTGLLLGTAQYLSPEQTIGGTVSYPCDVYALGLVLLECLTGRPAFPGVGIETAVVRLSRQPEIPAELGPRWADVLGAMTAREPEQRPTAGEVASLLSALSAPGSAEREAVSAQRVAPAAAVAPAGLPWARRLRLRPRPPGRTDGPPTEVGSVPTRAGASRRRRRTAWSVSVGAAAALATAVTVAATWSGTPATGEPATGATSPAPSRTASPARGQTADPASAPSRPGGPQRAHVVEARGHHLGTGPRPHEPDRHAHRAAADTTSAPAPGSASAPADDDGQLGRGHGAGGVAAGHAGSRPDQRRARPTGRPGGGTTNRHRHATRRRRPSPRQRHSPPRRVARRGTAASRTSVTSPRSTSPRARTSRRPADRPEARRHRGPTARLTMRRSLVSPDPARTGLPPAAPSAARDVGRSPPWDEDTTAAADEGGRRDAASPAAPYGRAGRAVACGRRGGLRWNIPACQERRARGRAPRVGAAVAHAGWLRRRRGRTRWTRCAPRRPTGVPHLLGLRYSRMAASPWGFLRGSAVADGRGPGHHAAHRACGCRPAATRTSATSGCSARPNATSTSTSTTSTRRCRRRSSGTSNGWPPVPWWRPGRTASPPTRAVRRPPARPAPTASTWPSTPASTRSTSGTSGSTAPRWRTCWHGPTSTRAAAPGAQADSQGAERRTTSRRSADSPRPSTARCSSGTTLRCSTTTDGDDGVVEHALSSYRSTLPHHVRVLFDRFELVDYAVKVVGVGSVGTRCWAALFISGDATRHPLVLQVKQADRSVLEPYARAAEQEHQGQRVVEGQRLIQAAERHLPGLDP